MTMFYGFPSFAASDEVTVSVPEYISIMFESSCRPDVQGNIIDADSLQLESANSSHVVITTNVDADLYVSAQSPVDGGTENALFGSGDGFIQNKKLVFTKNDNSAASEAVRNAGSSNPSPENNKNAFAVKLHSFAAPNGVYTPETRYGGTLENGNVHFDISQGLTSVHNNTYGNYVYPNTFSPQDASGIYTVTITYTVTAK